MKILLSAYECLPEAGSEFGIGWQWARGLARRGHQVWVVTRMANQEAIEEYRARTGNCDHDLRFIYVNLPVILAKTVQALNIFYPRASLQHNYFEYALWQFWSYRVVRKTHRQVGFDLAHHITIGSIRLPSFLGRLGPPFLFGPLGGGETAPRALRKGYGWRGRLLESIRDVGNLFVHFGPAMSSSFASAQRIMVTTKQTLSLVPRRFRAKTDIRVAIGIETSLLHAGRQRKANTRRYRLRVLFAGRMIYWKGMHLGLEAMSLLASRYPDCTLTMIGSGPTRARWHRMVQERDLQTRVEWIEWRPRSELLEIYRKHDVLLYPSLHDSGGFVVLEALAAGLPVVCLDLGGPAVLVDDTCGCVVPVGGCTESEVADGLANALVHIGTNPEVWNSLSSGALSRAARFTWDKTVDHVYRDLPPTTKDMISNRGPRYP